jgi:hypothetical protein
MKKGLNLLPLLGLSCALQAQSWEVFLSSGVQSPASGLASETLDPYGDRLGRSLSPSSDFRQLSLGADYNLLSYGPWRLRAGCEVSLGGPSPDLAVRYLAISGLASYYVQAAGSLKLTSINPGFAFVYVAPWAGEYGLGLEGRVQRLTFDAGSVNVLIPGESGTLPGATLKYGTTSPFLTAHAAFVQQYPEYAVFARFTLAFDLKSATSVDSYSQAQFGGLDGQLLAALLPRKEVKVSAGMRF